ncbi:MAG: ParB N-terminal domain-containing protein [Methylobacterium sp.]|uniref:ParB N-terminal domain-containing protein n=1 Tax=Methylobacterium sp. TaxID=409 RepID=UPI00271C8015|nr:ParB N-terminal domain-containing protein [Methylobacterium sp.]MDO9427047.1 ParB N-terminal domain-containing protein [Methylobacterium sp.]
MTDPDLILIPPSDLRPTEAFHPDRVRAVIALIVAGQAWTQPICVERASLAILDGHHRHAAALQLGLARVPVRMFDYERVELGSWRDDWCPTRLEVLRRARDGDLYPPKTTRHTFTAGETISIALARLT